MGTLLDLAVWPWVTLFWMVHYFADVYAYAYCGSVVSKWEWEEGLEMAVIGTL